MTMYTGERVSYDDREEPFDQSEAIEPIDTDQQGPHNDLHSIVTKHTSHAWRKPVPAHTQQAADEALEWLQQQNKPVILDSFCGTGMSTAWLAQHYPDHAVIGVDKSEHRLNKHVSKRAADNYLLVRAECEPLWRVLVDEGVKLSRHFMLYPNPWPKAKQVKRRIHGHPGFPLLKALGGEIEVRSNWQIYVEEFGAAFELLKGQPGNISTYQFYEPMTLFEKKYFLRGQTLWRFTGKF